MYTLEEAYACYMISRDPAISEKIFHGSSGAYGREGMLIVELLGKVNPTELSDKQTVQTWLASIPIPVKIWLTWRTWPSPIVIDFLSEDPDMLIRSKLASTTTSIMVMKKLYDSSNVVIQKQLLTNPLLPSYLVRACAQHPDPSLRAAAANHNNLDAITAKILKNDLTTSVRENLASNTSTPQNVLYTYAQTENEPVVSQVSMNEKSSVRTLKSVLKRLPGFSYSKNMYFLLAAGNRNLPVQVAKMLAEHSDVQVRKQLAGNDRVPPTVLASLVNDELEVRRTLSTNVGVYRKTLDVLATDTDTQVRMNVASNWHTCRKTLETLTTDVSVDVAAAARDTIRRWW